MEINAKKDITTYITDMAYEDGKGWIPLIGGTFCCTLNKLENKVYNIEVNCYSEEGSKNLTYI